MTHNGAGQTGAFTGTLTGPLDSLRERHPEAVLDICTYMGDTTLEVAADSLLAVCTDLRDTLGFNHIIDVTAIDNLGRREPRFDVVYIIRRLEPPDYMGSEVLRIKVRLPGPEPRIASVTTLWRGADWLEREVLDMFGIEFTGHPDPRRMLLPDDFEGHPLRKDFDVRNREPSKRSFERALTELETDFTGTLDTPIPKNTRN